ncbi:MAG: sulfite exporter TauE/SafE family protein [Chloroflexota bacterium]|jgi:uncharacterized membrane protein YfcA
MTTEMLIAKILLFMLAGFVAQLIDGALGMAYGVSSNTLLLSMGVPPAAASASVHTAEMFTTGISGFSHFKLGNVNKKLVLNLVLPGVIGGVVGAYLLTSINGDVIKPFVSAYLLIMGVVILYRVLSRNSQAQEKEHKGPRLYLLALIGGFFDAIGGGGWGPIVTSTLVADGHNPRFTIGSVNATEFFVTVAESVAFILTLRTGLVEYWPTILGLLLGGVVAAPLAAVVCQKIPARTLTGMVGVLITLLSIRTIYLTVAA